MDNVGASSKPASNAASVAPEVKVTIATQTGIEEADKRFDISKLSTDHHCYECKVKYRDPRPKDLVMFLHAWAYSVSFQYLGLECAKTRKFPKPDRTRKSGYFGFGEV